MAKVGGTGAVQAADAKIQEVADKVLAAAVAAHSIHAVSPSLPPSLPCPQVRPTLEKESGQVFQEYKAETFCSQVVAGLNYFIKVVH